MQIDPITLLLYGAAGAAALRFLIVAADAAITAFGEIDDEEEEEDNDTDYRYARLTAAEEAA